MKEFDVTITETLKLTVSVEASSKEEAQQMVSDQWHAGVVACKIVFLGRLHHTVLMQIA